MKRQCRRCMARREDVASCSRMAGGSYRRGNRHTRSSLCVPCARELLSGISHGQLSVSSWDTSGVIAVALMTSDEEARAGVTPTVRDVLGPDHVTRLRPATDERPATGWLIACGCGWDDDGTVHPTHSDAGKSANHHSYTEREKRRGLVFAPPTP